MALDPKRIAEWRIHATRVMANPDPHDDTVLGEATLALLSELERLDQECVAKDEVIEIARQEIAKLRAAPARET